MQLRIWSRSAPGRSRAFAAALLKAGGFTDDQAEQTAAMLVWANLRGADLHGVLRISRYVEMVELGLINPAGEPRQVSGKGAVAVIDADRAPGAVGMNLAATNRDAAGGCSWHRLVCSPFHYPCRRDRILRAAGRHKWSRRDRHDRLEASHDLPWIPSRGRFNQPDRDRCTNHRSGPSPCCSTCRPHRWPSARSWPPRMPASRFRQAGLSIRMASWTTGSARGEGPFCRWPVPKVPASP